MSALNGGHSTVIITGGGSGLGLASGRRLLTDWPNVQIVSADIRPGEIESLASEFGKDRVLYIEANVAHVGIAAEVVEKAVAWSGNLSGLVNCAGNSTNHASLDLTSEQWREVLDCHLDGHFYMCQAFARHLIDKNQPGAIVNFSSLAHAFGWPRRLPYSVAKAGIDALTRTLAVEWAEYGLRVNAIAPGYINTPLVVRATENGYLDPTIVDMHAMGRFGEPNEIATGVKYLLSDDASFITGEILTIDGGFSAKRIPWK
jgi:NAD(P)-dependent dehydrogenase (short-subunit alcohol dehydrogenase family)